MGEDGGESGCCWKTVHLPARLSSFLSIFKVLSHLHHLACNGRHRCWNHHAPHNPRTPGADVAFWLCYPPGVHQHTEDHSCCILVPSFLRILFQIEINPIQTMTSRYIFIPLPKQHCWQLNRTEGQCDLHLQLCSPSYKSKDNPSIIFNEKHLMVFSMLGRVSFPGSQW